MSPVVERNRPQHMVALERANAIRLARARLKREIKAGRLAVVEVLDKVPECARTMPVLELLRAQRAWGMKKSKWLLIDVDIPEHRQLGSLTLRQRSILIEALGGEV